MQVDDNCLFRIVHIPEHAPAVLIERSRGNYTRHIGSGQPQAVPPAARDLWVCSNTCNVGKRYFEAALQSPKFVSAANMQRQLAFCYRKIDHWIAPCSSLNQDCRIRFQIGGISRLLFKAQSLSAPRTCSVSLPSATERSTIGSLPAVH